MSTTLTLVLGTRPEIVKLSPVIRACQRQSIPFSIVHTGQHYSQSLDGAFFDQLELPQPDHNLAVGSASHGEQTGAMICGIEETLLADEPDTVLVQGDTNTVLAGAIATSKLDAELGHVEAGLRSYDREMPEEINRRLADHAADSLFAPTERARENLLGEGIPDERIVVTGNTIVDAVYQHVELARERSRVLADLDLPAEFALLTAHREENVDDPERFRSLLTAVAAAASDHDLPVVYPIHPRAEDRLRECGIEVPSAIEAVEPRSFVDFLRLEDAAKIAFTDSGGVQEECCILQTPCVTLRENTERPETVEVGANTVVGVAPEAVRAGARQMLATDPSWENPFGDGTATQQILDAIADSVYDHE